MTTPDAPVVTPRQLLQQAWSDWGGKEVQTGYTLTYVWMANQLGHFTIGFGLTLMLTWIGQLLIGWLSCACTQEGFVRITAQALSLPGDIRPMQALCGWTGGLAVGQVLFWAGKEYRDIRVVRHDAQGNLFALNQRDLFLDAGTAILFIAFGVAVAYASFWSWQWAVIVFMVALALALMPAHYWMSRKYCFQRACLPFLFRLSDITGRIACPQNNAVGQVQAFVAGQGCCRHLLVFGERGTGRTTLAVAMLTEHCFQVRRARYASWAKFLETADSIDQVGQHNGQTVWAWQDCDIIALDDVMVVPPGTSPLLADFERGLNALPPAARQMLNQRRTVWVLGATELADAPQWAQALAGALHADVTTCHYIGMQRGADRDRRKLTSRFLGH